MKNTTQTEYCDPKCDYSWHNIGQSLLWLKRQHVGDFYNFQYYQTVAQVSLTVINRRGVLLSMLFKITEDLGIGRTHQLICAIYMSCSKTLVQRVIAGRLWAEDNGGFARYWMRAISWYVFFNSGWVGPAFHTKLGEFDIQAATHQLMSKLTKKI